MKHINWDRVPAERLNDKFVRKLAWDGKIMIGQTLVEKGYVVPLHAHDNQQVTFVTSGVWRFKLEGWRRWWPTTSSRRRVMTGSTEMTLICVQSDLPTAPHDQTLKQSTRWTRISSR